MSLKDKGKFGFLYMLSNQSAENLLHSDWANIQNWPYQSHSGPNYTIITSQMYFNRVAEFGETVVALWTMNVLKDRMAETGNRTWEELVPILEAERVDFKYMVGTTQKIALQAAAALNERIANMMDLIETKGLKLTDNRPWLMESEFPTPQTAVVMLDTLERQVQVLEAMSRDLSSYEHRHCLQAAARLVEYEDKRKPLNPPQSYAHA